MFSSQGAAMHVVCETGASMTPVQPIISGEKERKGFRGREEREREKRERKKKERDKRLTCKSSAK